MYNLAGKHAGGYGTPFDLDDLLADPLVIDEAVDLDNIQYVRLFDIPGNGAFLDGQGNPILDNWMTTGTGGFDFRLPDGQGVGVIHAVPEPGTLAALFTGTMALLGLRVFRRARAGQRLAVAVLSCSALLSASGAYADAYHFGDAWVEVDYWAGSGSNEAMIVIDWNETNGPYVTPNHAWGYRWDGTQTIVGALTALGEVGPLVVTTGYGGAFLNDAFYNDATDGDAHTSAGYTGFWAIGECGNGVDWQMNSGIASDLIPGGYAGMNMNGYEWGLDTLDAPFTTAPASVVDFEDLSPDTPYTGPGGGDYCNGPASNGYDEPDPGFWGGTRHVGTFSSGGAAFVNRYNLTYESWNGFAYSNTTDVTTAGYTNQFSAYAGSGHGAGDDNYGVAYGYLDVLDPNDPAQLAELPYFELPEDAQIQSAYVTNTTYAALSMLEGDDFAVKFGWRDVNDDGDYDDEEDIKGDYPDWFKLTAYGTDASGVPLAETVELYLADYRFEDNEQDYIINEWTLLDLSPLADASRVYFNLSSSDVDPLWGMNTPGYFAIDDISFVVSEPSLPGDANDDKIVDAKDASILGAHWLQQGGATWGQGDFNGDRNVDDRDAAILAAHWLQTAEGACVPEPSVTMLLLTSAVAVLAGARRWRRG